MQKSRESDDLLVVLTGAGISAESGVPTFRSNGGLWRTYRYQDLATPEAFQKDPLLVWEFYRWRQENVKKSQPNPGHLVLAQLAKQLGRRMVLVTQNVDDLHERAGSSDVIHMHGEIMKARCIHCQSVLAAFDYQDSGQPCPRCKAPRTLRPHIVWFGETPLHMEEIHTYLNQATVFMTIGSSGTVYPAAQFVETARANGAFTLLLNLEAADNTRAFHRVLQGPSSALLQEMITQGENDIFDYFRRLRMGN
ncbi:MAG: NAD-dependent deacylase [Magnetococcales bacterium]|nr:NAD-dependent deacylase [Magnetococcales bacterium]NGZ28985.1 NAD-dependent deacylase [Magnetococcales bacterium]